MTFCWNLSKTLEFIVRGKVTLNFLLTHIQFYLSITVICGSCQWHDSSTGKTIYKFYNSIAQKKSVNILVHILSSKWFLRFYSHSPFDNTLLDKSFTIMLQNTVYNPLALHWTVLLHPWVFPKSQVSTVGIPHSPQRSPLYHHLWASDSTQLIVACSGPPSHTYSILFFNLWNK